MAQGSAAVSQLNIRLDSHVKESGDAVLKRMGITPSELVRALWAKISEGMEGCEEVLDVLKPTKAGAADDPMGKGAAFIARIEARKAALAALVVEDSLAPSPMSDDELEDALWEEWQDRDRERGTI